MLLQLVEHAIQRNWIVIYIPRGKLRKRNNWSFFNLIWLAVDIVNSTTSFAYDIRTRTYLQPHFSFQTLQRMLTVNKTAFESIYLPNSIVLDKQTIPAGTNLAKAIGIIVTEKNKSGSVASSPALLEGVMRTLDTQTK